MQVTVQKKRAVMTRFDGPSIQPTPLRPVEPAKPEPGRYLAGRFKIIRELGAGAHGAVYLCSDRDEHNARRAVKVFPITSQQREEDPTLIQRFQNEANFASRVRHPFVVRSFDYFCDDGIVGYSMEYVEGGDLRDLIDEEQDLSVARIVEILIQIASGVDAIHKEGIVHRDLKPENILVAENGDVKISDFGIARIDDGKKLTAPGGLLGTLDYLSPEYLMNGQLDERSDIYSIGLIGYELITKHRPFSGESMMEALRAKLSKEPRPPHELHPACPRALSGIIMKALSREPSARFASGFELFAELRKLKIDFDRQSKDSRPRRHLGEAARSDTTVQVRPSRQDSLSPTKSIDEVAEAYPRRPAMTYWDAVRIGLYAPLVLLGAIAVFYSF